MISCHQVVTELWDYLDGELPVERAALIADHLAECARCYPHYRFEYAFLATVARQRSRGPGPSAELVEKIAASLVGGTNGPRVEPRRPTPRTAAPLPAHVPLVRRRARLERWALAVLRVSLGALLLLCAARLGLVTATAAIVPKLLAGVAALEGTLSLTVLLGAWRRWTYGAALLVHATALVFLWRELHDPWGLAAAAFPAGGALVTLYLLRDRDTWTLDAWLAWRRPWRVVR